MKKRLIEINQSEEYPVYSVEIPEIIYSYEDSGNWQNLVEISEEEYEKLVELGAKALKLYSSYQEKLYKLYKKSITPSEYAKLNPNHPNLAIGLTKDGDYLLNSDLKKSTKTYGNGK